MLQYGWMCAVYECVDICRIEHTTEHPLQTMVASDGHCSVCVCDVSTVGRLSSLLIPPSPHYRHTWYNWDETGMETVARCLQIQCVRVETQHQSGQQKQNTIMFDYNRMIMRFTMQHQTLHHPSSHLFNSLCRSWITRDGQNHAFAKLCTNLFIQLSE